MNAAAAQRILIAYSTTDGHTLRICQRLQQVMEALGSQVTVSLLAQADALDLASFDRIVVGASIRYGHHQPLVTEFVNRHPALLESRPSAFFTVNIVARKPDKNTPETNPYCRKFLHSVAWKPALAVCSPASSTTPAMVSSTAR